jgi:hypothetical protein
LVGFLELSALQVSQLSASSTALLSVLPFSDYVSRFLGHETDREEEIRTLPIFSGKFRQSGIPEKTDQKKNPSVFLPQSPSLPTASFLQSPLPRSIPSFSSSLPAREESRESVVFWLLSLLTPAIPPHRSSFLDYR